MELNKIKIIEYSLDYQEKMISCLQESKITLGRIPKVNTDLLNIKENYNNNGDIFLLALNEANDVVGMLGTKTTKSNELWLKRFYVHPRFKRRGIGSKLLLAVLEFARSKHIEIIYTRIALDYKEGYQFYLSKGFVEIDEIDDLKYLKLDINK